MSDEMLVCVMSDEMLVCVMSDEMLVCVMCHEMLVCARSRFPSGCAQVFAHTASHCAEWHVCPAAHVLAPSAQVWAAWAREAVAGESVTCAL